MLYLSRWLSLLQEARGEPRSDDDANHGCTRCGLVSLCQNIAERVKDMGWEHDLYDVGIWTKLANIAVVVTGDPMAFFDGSIGFISQNLHPV